MGEKEDNLQSLELETIQNLKKNDFVEFKIPQVLYDTACKSCCFKNNGCCTGFCVKKFISSGSHGYASV